MNLSMQEQRNPFKIAYNNKEFNFYFFKCDETITLADARDSCFL